MEGREVEPNGIDEDWESVMIESSASAPVNPQPFQFHQPQFQDSSQGTRPSDSDMDTNNLIQQFNCLGTTDKEVLVLQLQKLIGPSLNNHAAQFFLDMNNWNLQRAIGSYFDLTTDEQASWNENATLRNYSMALVDSQHEITVAPNTKFSVTWKLMNNGTESWPPGSHLKTHTNYAFLEIVFLPSQFGVQVGEICSVVVELSSPPEVGTCLVNYQLTTPEGYSIGPVINLIMNVVSDETIDLSQQFQNLRWNGTDGSGENNTHNNLEMS